MTEQEVADALLAAANASLSGFTSPPVVAYDTDGVPAERPDLYAVLFLGPRFGGAPELLDGSTNVTDWRATFRYVGRMPDFIPGAAANVRAVRSAIRAALSGQRVTFGAETVVVQKETSDPVTEDEGWFTAADEFVFTLA